MPNIGQLVRSAGFKNNVFPVAASLTGNLLGRRATNNAVNNLSAGATDAMSTIRTGSSAARQTLNPFVEASAPARQQIQNGTGAGGEFNTPFTSAEFDLYKDPSYQWRLSEGQRALQAQANANGSRFSGGFNKALNDYSQNAASQEYAAAFGRRETDLGSRFNRLMAAAGMGQQAAGDLAGLDTSTANQIAGLQTDLASARAAGDIQKANGIQSTISQILGQVQNEGTNRLVNTAVQEALKKAGLTAGTTAASAATVPAISALVGGAAAPTMSGTAALLANAGIGFPSLAAPAAAAQASGLAAAGAAPTATAGGGLGSSLAALATNPYTLAIAGAIGVGTLWAKSQAHHEANDWVKTQNDFDRQQAAIDQRAARGEIDEKTRQELRRLNSVDYIAAAMDFARRKGSDGRQVIQNAMRTFQQWYGSPQQFGYTGV